MKNVGYTLIEIMVALSVFALLAVMTSTAMYHAFDTRARINKQTDELNTIQVALTLIKQDTEQAIERSVRDVNMHLLPAFIGEKKYMAFTRSGYINPGSLQKRSNLQRVAYLCEQGKLIRRTWEHLDTPDQREAHDKILLNNLTACSFNYVTHTQQILSSWHAADKTSPTTKLTKHSKLPAAIRLTLALPNWGDAHLLFVLPRGLYGQSR